MRLVFGTLAALIFSAPSSHAQDLPAPRASGQDVYVSCYLLVHETDVPQPNGRSELFSASTCAAMSVVAIATREGDRPEVKYRFCLPSRSSVSGDPARAMARAYLDWYETKGFAAPDQSNGAAMFVISQVETFPCAGAR